MNASTSSNAAALEPIPASRSVGLDPTTIAVGATYLAYASSMLLRMIPTVAGNAIRADETLGIDLAGWGRVLAAGTCGALAGKFLCGYAADRFGGKRTFSAALFLASAFVGMFALSNTLVMFQASFFLTLMAQAAGWPSMTKIVVNWVTPRNYGRVWGVLSTSSRVGTLAATFLLGSLLAWISWRVMLGAAAVVGAIVAVYYALRMRERPEEPLAESSSSSSAQSAAQSAREPHPFDRLSLGQACPHFVRSLSFWLIAASLMGLTILWDFLLLAPMYLQDTLGLSAASASQAASAFPFGSLIAVLGGGYLFDRLRPGQAALMMAGLLTSATACLAVFAMLPGWTLSPLTSRVLPIVLLFLFGACLSPCYYIPVSIFSIRFGGRHSGFLVSLLDAIGFAATASFYYFGGGIAKEHGWSLLLWVLSGVSLWSLAATYGFLKVVDRSAIQR
ncbi:MAG: MFS transporter [Pirellulales bacterium]